mmetsp:Transcript_7692/g.19714  ORF Transcript_7692/g.19714 Transcript_7692/m.19714 type:complete len:206 (-) Transcript_7692:690-1307(-)
MLERKWRHRERFLQGLPRGIHADLRHRQSHRHWGVPGSPGPQSCPAGRPADHSDGLCCPEQAAGKGGLHVAHAVGWTKGDGKQRRVSLLGGGRCVWCPGDHQVAELRALHHWRAPASDAAQGSRGQRRDLLSREGGEARPKSGRRRQGQVGGKHREAFGNVRRRGVVGAPSRMGQDGGHGPRQARRHSGRSRCRRGRHCLHECPR